MKHAIGDAVVITKRQLLQLARVPELLVLNITNSIISKQDII